jgi:hypothetical protein
MTQAQNLADLSQLFQVAPLANRNYIVDGAKENWSNNASVPIPNAYSPCVLYLANAGAGGVGNYGRSIAGAGPVGRLGWPRAGNNFSTFTMTTASTGSLAARTCPYQATRIEDVNILESGSFTFSITLSAAAPVTITQLALAQNFGSGGSPSPNVMTLVPINWPVTTTWQRFSVRLDIPSIAGMTMGTTDTKGWTQIEIDYPVGSTYAISDGFWQLEACPPGAPAAGLPTPFEYRGQQAELARTQRLYLTKSVRTNVFNAPFSSAQLYAPMSYPVVMRIPPNVTWTPAGISGCATPTVADGYNDGCSCMMLSTLTGSCYYQVTAFVADARL